MVKAEILRSQQAPNCEDQGRVEPGTRGGNWGSRVADRPALLAAIAAITESGFSISVRRAMLTVYNVVFVLPLVAILIAVEVLGDNAGTVLGRANRWLQTQRPVLLAGFGLLIGLVILALGLIGLSAVPSSTIRISAV